MEIRINKEIKDYHESLFMGLSMRQFMCSLGAVGAAVGIYFGLSNVLERDPVSWLCIVCAAPLAAAGFFKYRGMNFEQFVNEETDTTIYAFNKLITLLSNVNPNTIELLGLNKNQYLHISPIGQELLDNKKIFLSKRVIHSFGGYATAQLRRFK